MGALNRFWKRSGNWFIIGFSCLLAILMIAFRAGFYHFLQGDLALELLLGITALGGIFLGIFWPRKPQKAPAPDLKALKWAGSPDALLSGREMEILLLMAQGLSNQEIADQLHVSLNTIKTHNNRLFQKLDVSRRTQAIHKAQALGWIKEAIVLKGENELSA